MTEVPTVMRDGQPTGDHGHLREAQLIVDLCRTVIPAPLLESAGEVLNAGIDWDYALIVARRNAVSPLFGRNLLRNFAHKLPDNVRGSIEAELETHVQHNLFVTGTLVNLVRLFEDRGIGLIPFKGPVLSVKAYGDPAIRKYGDLDVLVRPRQFDDAINLLKELGWEPLTSVNWMTKRDWSISRRKDVYLVDKSGKVNLELHWKLSGSHFGLPKEMIHLWERVESFDLAGTEVLTLSLNDLLIYLCLHGSRHSWERFAWICDVHQLVLYNVDIDWGLVFSESRELGCERVVALGLRLMKDFFGFQTQSADWARVIEHPIYQEISSEIRQRLFSAEAHDVMIADRYLYHLKLKERLGDRLKLHFHYILWYMRLFATPNETDRQMIHLPRALYPLYFITRPVRLIYNFVIKQKESGVI